MSASATTDHDPELTEAWTNKAKRAVSTPRRRAADAFARRIPSQLPRLNHFRANERYCLIVLDACRWDVFDALAPLFIGGRRDPVRSVGFDTFQWMSRAWHRDLAPRRDAHSCHYVSGAVPINHHQLDNAELRRLYDGVAPANHIESIDPVWRDEWDETVGACPPEPVTDRAIGAAANHDRLVVHYMQPHAPYLGVGTPATQLLGNNTNPGVGEPVDAPIWRGVRSNRITDERLRYVYEWNCRRALREAVRLVDALDDRPVVVTADHGEALGEYGHYMHERRPHPHVRTIPWAVVEGTRGLA